VPGGRSPGVKLHPRAERFDLRHPGVAAVVASAAERRLPVTIHSGFGIGSLGRDALMLAERYPGAPLILAHLGVTDLAWVWRRLGGRPSLFFDTAWWNPADHLALFALVPRAGSCWAATPPTARRPRRRSSWACCCTGQEVFHPRSAGTVAVAADGGRPGLGRAGGVIGGLTAAAPLPVPPDSAGSSPSGSRSAVSTWFRSASAEPGQVCAARASARHDPSPGMAVEWPGRLGGVT
jgi:hypothetical protein